MLEGNTQRKRVLVVDDDRPTCEMIAKTLANTGLITTQAFSGEEALEHFKLENPDLVVIDFAMPGMNGIEAVAAMRAVESKPFLVLMVAGYAQSFLSALDVASGVNSYLIKPILPQELITRVQDLFAGRY